MVLEVSIKKFGLVFLCPVPGAVGEALLRAYISSNGRSVGGGTFGTYSCTCLGTGSLRLITTRLIEERQIAAKTIDISHPKGTDSSKPTAKLSAVCSN
jgi:hypothetical protein